MLIKAFVFELLLFFFITNYCMVQLNSKFEFKIIIGKISVRNIPVTKVGLEFNVAL